MKQNILPCLFSALDLWLRESFNLGKRLFARLVGVDANMIRLWESERKQISLKSWEKYFKDRITL